jgi:hypothetical protein
VCALASTQSLQNFHVPSLTKKGKILSMSLNGNNKIYRFKPVILFFNPLCHRLFPDARNELISRGEEEGKRKNCFGLNFASHKNQPNFQAAAARACGREWDDVGIWSIQNFRNKNACTKSIVGAAVSTD